MSNHDGQILTIMQGDTLPYIIMQIYDNTSGDPVDLSDPRTSVFFKFRERNTDATLFSAECEKLAGGYAGQVFLAWPVGALSVDDGRYEAEVSVVYLNSLVQRCADPVQFKLKPAFGNSGSVPTLPAGVRIVNGGLYLLNTSTGLWHAITLIGGVPALDIGSGVVL